MGIVILCAAMGLAIGVAVACRTTHLKVTRYAHHLLGYAEAFSDEINSTLEEVNASPYPFCSDQDITMLRGLVFRGHLVKEIGRVRNNMLYCTSMNGRFDEPKPTAKPDIVMRSGKTVRLNSPLISAPGVRGDITQSGEADFVAARDSFDHLGESPMLYTTTLTNHETNQVLRTAGAPLLLTNQEIFGEKTVIRNQTLYVSRCSARFAPCMVTGIRLRDAWELNSNLIGGFVIIGSLCGVGLALTLVLQPRKRSLATQLRRALRRNLITVVYQPIVEVKTNRIVGAEALARWTD
jgi:sensor c-di-GMP phosphodiesterase-like protein